MTDRELLEKIAGQVGALTNQVDSLTNQFGTLNDRVDSMTNQFGTLNDRVDSMTNQFGTMNDRVDTLTNQVGSLTKQVDGLQTEMQEGFREAYIERQEMKAEIHDIKETVIKIEDDHGKKLSALFDGYKQNTDILERVEKKVSEHEEIILRRIQ